MLGAVTIDNPIALVSALIGLGAAAGAAWAVFRSRATRDTIDTLEQALRIERTERQVENDRCNKELAKLQGQVMVLENGLGDHLANAMHKHMLEHLGELVESAVDELQRRRRGLDR